MIGYLNIITFAHIIIFNFRLHYIVSFAVVTRVKVSFIDTIVRLEHLPREAKTGAAIEFRIGRSVSVMFTKLVACKYIYTLIITRYYYLWIIVTNETVIFCKF